MSSVHSTQRYATDIRLWVDGKMQARNLSLSQPDCDDDLAVRLPCAPTKTRDWYLLLAEIRQR